MERTPIDSYEAQHSPRNQRDYEPVAHRRWRATASFELLCHSSNFLSDFENEHPWALARFVEAHLESRSVTTFEKSSERTTGPFKKTARGSCSSQCASGG